MSGLAKVTLAVLALSGCALTSKADPMEVRTFSPEMPRPASMPRPAAASSPGAPDRPGVQVGVVSAASHLRKKIVYRASSVEVGEYDDLRWAELPETYVRRGVERALFGDAGLPETFTIETPVLDLEVLAFEEVRDGPRRAARVTVSWELHDEAHALATRTVTIEERAKTAAPQDVARAMGVALARCTSEVAKGVTEALARAPLSSRRRGAEGTAP